MIKKLRLILFAALALSCSACNPEEAALDVRHVITVLTQDFYDVGYEETILDIEIDANCKWSISKTNAEGEGITWILTDVPGNVGSGPAKFKVKVCTNDTDQAREGVLNIFSDQVSAYIDIAQAANPDPDKEPEIFKGYVVPAYQLFDREEFTVEGTRVRFMDGLIVEKTSDSGKETVVVENSLLPGFAFNFSDAESLIFKIPLISPASGDFRFMYGSKDENITSAEAYQWSSDEGKTWYPVNRFAQALIPTFKSVWFTIPETEMVKSEGWLWIKATGTSADVSLVGGCALTKARAKTSTLEPEDSESVLISEGFDSTVDANASDLAAPGYMKSVAGEAWTSENPMIYAENCYARPGFIQIGAYDEADPGKAAAGSLTIKIGERLTAMNITEKVGINVSFKASVIDPEAQIDVISGETVLKQVSGMTAGLFGEKKLYFADIDNSTVLTIAAKGKDADSDPRVFIDDLYVTVTDASSAPLVLEFDFSVSSAMNFAGWDSRSGRTTDITKGYYTLNGETYVFQSAKKSPTTTETTYPSYGASSDPVGQLHMTQKSCLGLPMVEGYRLASITIITDDTNNTQPLYVEPERLDAPSAETAIMCEPVKGPEYTADLEGTLKDTVYWLYQGGSGSQAFDIKVLKLTFMPENNE